MKINRWPIILIVLFWCVACQQDETRPVESDTNADTSHISTITTEKKLDDPIANNLAPLQYKNALLVLGGSPSISAELNPPDLYSHRLGKFLTKEYTTINAAIANEPLKQLFRRLPILLQHDISIVVIELGADEAVQQLDKSSFKRKVAGLLKEIQQTKGDIPILIVPSSSESRYLDILEEGVSISANIQIITPADFSPLSAEWHEFIARQLAKQLDNNK